MVSRGEFREDLLYRINLMTIHLPPLRERPDDIPLLASRFLQARGAGLSARAADADRRRRRAGCRRSRGRATSGSCGSAVERAVLVEHARPARRRRLRRVSPRRPAARPPTRCPPVGSMTMDEIERAMIVKSLRHHGGNISKVAESLGLSRAGALSPLREIRDHRVSLRRRGSSPISSPCTLIFAGARPSTSCPRQPVLAGRRRGRLRACRWSIGLRLSREHVSAISGSPPRACA